MASRSLIVLPDDAATPILDAIGQARKSLRIKMFVFSDPALIGAVIAAQRRGVSVRVMLNPARRSGEEENEETRQQLARAGVDVIDSRSEEHTSELQSRPHLVCRLLLEKKKKGTDEPNCV